MRKQVSIHRRIEGPWAERIKSLKTIQQRIVIAAERALQRAFNGGALIPIRIPVDRRERRD
jgi:hypothetical protein